MERALQAILLLAVLTGLAAAQWHKQDRVLLREVNAITLHKGMMTNARRAAPVPQLRCVGGDACGVDLRVAQCENKGWDGRDVQWECKADLSNDYRFGDLAVNCEGYDYPDDPYILAGSCGLEYELTYTEQGQRNRYKHGYHQPYSSSSNDYGSRWSEYTNRWSDYTNRWSDTMSSWWRHPGDSWRSWWHRPWGHTYAAGPSYSGYSNSHGETTIWSVIVMAVVCFFILRACLHSFNIPAHYNIRPLFGHHATPHHNTGPGYYGGVGPAPGCDPATGAPTAGGPGFWTGLGVGGLLGNWWSRRRGTQYATRPVTPPPAYHAPNYRETTRTTSTDADHTGTRTASGFGGTRRR